MATLAVNQGISLTWKSNGLAFCVPHAHHVYMLKVDKTLVFASWVVVEPAEDIPGLWVSHCLDFDVVAQGESAQQAIEAVSEAVAMTVLDDVTHGLDPNERRAPPEYWEQLAHVLKHGQQVKLSEVTGKVTLATQVTLVLERLVEHNNDRAAPSDFSQFNVPPATAHVDHICAA